ncbi:hypothetical protein Tco_1372851, partial [Tanacetum coccineum]
IMPFSEGKLPAKYLGVPLISSRLLNREKKLGIGLEIGRTNLYRLRLIRGFLWCNGDYKRGKAKVAWDDICLPKHEGGLGLRSLEIGNGHKASLWHDMWSYQCPLSSYLSPRDITREGRTLQDCVADLIENGAWRWPAPWIY